MHATIEDIYTAMIETDRGVKEKVRIFDTGGLVCVVIITLYLSNDGQNRCSLDTHSAEKLDVTIPCHIYFIHF